MEVTGVCPAGFPHSDICGSQPTCGSPQLFAAGRVLRRQMVPWHPPCALLCLISTPETILSVSGFFAFILPASNFRLPASLFRLPSSGFSPSTGLPEKLILPSVCSCQGSGRLFGRLQGDPENDTASKFSNDSLCSSHFSSTALPDRSTLGCAPRISPRNSSLERR